MARKLRIQFPGAIYHVMSRGDRREDIFRDDFDRDSFLQTLGDACAKTAWEVHAYCLMANHFHLVVETPQPNLVAGMKWFLGTYTARFNRRHKLNGHVFAGRYKSLLVGSEGGYLRTVCDYVHLNPARAKLLPSESALRKYPWSSLPLFVAEPSGRPDWLRVDRIFGECGKLKDSAAGRNEFEQRLEVRRAQETDEEFAPVRRGWCFGNEHFREELLAQVEGGAGEYHYGSEIQEAAESKAGRIIAEELRRSLWTEAELALRRKGDPGKIQIARRLREETTVTLQWIAARLHMGTKTHVSHLLYWNRRAEREGSPANRAASQKPGETRPKAVTGARPRNELRGHSRFTETLTLARSAERQSGVKNTSIPLTDPEGVGGFDTRFD